MPKHGRTIFLQVPDSEDRKEFLKHAGDVWDNAHPSRTTRKGRSSDQKKIKRAIRKILEECSSNSSEKCWTLKEWVDRVRERIDYSHASATKGRATIEKYVKEFLSGGAYFLHHMPISQTQRKPLEEQLQVYLSQALAKAFRRTTEVNGIHSLRYELVNRLHHELCTTHIPRRIRPTEQARTTWFVRKWNALIHMNTVNPVKIESRGSLPQRPAS